MCAGGSKRQMKYRTRLKKYRLIISTMASRYLFYII